MASHRGRALTDTVNMNHKELTDWLENPRNLLASLDTGHISLRRLVQGDHFIDPEFARKVDNFNNRHSAQGRLFGQEAGHSGWSKRAIALRNWGHDPSKPSSPLYSADQDWLADHAGTAQRRRGRIANPSVIAAVQAPTESVSDAMSFSDLVHPHESADFKRHRRSNTCRIDFPVDHYSEHSAWIPLGRIEILVALAPSHGHSLSPSAMRLGQEATQNFCDNIGKDLPYEEDAVALRQLRPAIEHSVATGYSNLPRTPNPPISKWILPLAQFLVSGSGLIYSVTELVGAFFPPPPQEAEGEVEVEDTSGEEVFIPIIKQTKT
jgi:hypothetical protein